MQQFSNVFDAKYQNTLLFVAKHKKNRKNLDTSIRAKKAYLRCGLSQHFTPSVEIKLKDIVFHRVSGVFLRCFFCFKSFSGSENFYANPEVVKSFQKSLSVLSRFFSILHINVVAALEGFSTMTNNPICLYSLMRLPTSKGKAAQPEPLAHDKGILLQPK